MDVLMKRSTKIAPVSLSTSYFTGSAFIGISMITLNESGTCFPGVTRSRDMVGCESGSGQNAGSTLILRASVVHHSLLVRVPCLHPPGCPFNQNRRPVPDLGRHP